MKKNAWILMLVVGVASVIFVLSSMPYEKQSLVPLLEAYLPTQWITKNFSNVEIHYAGNVVNIENYGVAHFVEFFIRKGAHLSIFAALAIGLFLFIRKWLPVVYTFAISLFLTVGYAALDELHQHFTGGRSPMWQDVLLDSIGALIGLTIISFICAVRKKRVTYNENRNEFQKEIIKT